MATSTTQACYEIPPVIAEGYNAKGTYETYANTSCYITGHRDAKNAVFFIYDVFGYQSQTLQGADILSSTGYLVVVPDFWQGQSAQPEWLARDTEEKKKAFASFRERLSDTSKHVRMLHEVLSSLQGTFTNVEKWGAIGYCWGGKICTLTSGTDTPWTVAIETSPSRTDLADGDTISIPFASLISKDEDRSAFEAKHARITGPKKLEVFDTQIHGWMSARADLGDPEVHKEYERGYRIALQWLEEYL